MSIKNIKAATNDLKALNKRARELIRIMKSGNSTDAETQEFLALPTKFGPARGKALTAMTALLNDKTVN